MNFYNSNRWVQKRQFALKRDNYMCQQSKRYGKLRQAEIVHHIFPYDEFPQYGLCDWNLISLTRKEHNKLHNRDTDELTEAGRELLVRTARKHGIAVPEQYQYEHRKQRQKEYRTRYE